MNLLDIFGCFLFLWLVLRFLDRFNWNWLVLLFSLFLLGFLIFHLNILFIGFYTRLYFIFLQTIFFLATIFFLLLLTDFIRSISLCSSCISLSWLTSQWVFFFSFFLLCNLLFFNFNHLLFNNFFCGIADFQLFFERFISICQFWLQFDVLRLIIIDKFPLS